VDRRPANRFELLGRHKESAVWSGLKEGDPALHFGERERTISSISMVAMLAKLEFERAEY
jgi:hypothetical protein